VSPSFSGIEWHLDDGNYIVIYHAQQAYVRVNDPVWSGTQIGMVGSYGQSSGCHIHFEVDGANHIPGHFQDWTDVDPINELSSAHIIGNLLANGSFENSANPWQVYEIATNLTAYNNSNYAVEGSWYGEMNTSQTNGSVYQDVAIAAQAGQSYTFSIWVRSADGTAFSGMLNLFALGNPVQGASTRFTAGGSWTQVTVGLGVTSGGSTSLRAQIYMTTTGHNLDVDGAQIVDAGLTSASFENSANPWQVYEIATNLTAYNNSNYAVEGSWYGEMNTSQTNGSVYQDVAIAAQAGQSYTFSIWVRSADGTAFSGMLNLFALGNPVQGASTNFTAGGSWTSVAVGLDLTAGGHSALRAQLYMTTTGHNLDVDAAQLVNAIVSNSHFESGSPAPWQPFEGTTNQAVYQNSSYAIQGSYYMEMNVGQAAGSVFQKVGIVPRSGHTYTFTVWIRCRCTIIPFQTASGTAAVFALGNANPGVGTNFLVSAIAWTRVSVAIDPPVAGSPYSAAQVQIYLNTVGVNVDIVGPTLSGGNLS
jgi:hypothetical protein